MLQTHDFPGTQYIDKEITGHGFDPATFHTAKGWPRFYVPVKFRMKSCKQALNEGNWESAGEVLEQALLLQDSDPQSKRRKPFYNRDMKRIDTIIHELPKSEWQTKYHDEVKPEARKHPGFSFDGIDALTPHHEVIEALRQSEMKEEEYEWEQVWGE
jgi:hypothetical protein